MNKIDKDKIWKIREHLLEDVNYYEEMAQKSSDPIDKAKYQGMADGIQQAKREVENLLTFN